ncbi:hypothetical protein V498_02976 [Pseudogymnoascus sp. VKM F-4517 (FW-2822)]|nr:hypothetical protein V498_02976 [Pseudogymnoascus sp. VKM F-4517 (FW-2822)]
MRSLQLPLAIGGFATLTNALMHELVVGNFVNNVLYTLSFDDKIYTLDLIANHSVETRNSWLAFNHDKTHLYGTDIIYTLGEKNWTKPPVYVSHTINNSSSITHDKTLTGKQGCVGASIFVIADKNPPYNVYGVDFWGNPGCGTVFSVDETGAFDEVIQDYEYAPESSIHGTAFSPDSTFMYSADMHGNSVWTHPVDTKTGLVGEPLHRSDGPVPHAEPRHVTVHKTGKAIYIVTEQSNQVAWYKIDKRTGIPQMQEPVYSILPPDADVEGYRGDEVVVSPSGKYLWATTRSRDTSKPGYITVFELDKKHGGIVRQNFVLRTSSSGGVANAVTPMDVSDRFVSLTDSADGFVQIWELAKDAKSASVVAHISLKDQGNDRGLTLMTGFWYTRREIPLRQCIWYSSLGWGGIVGSYMAMGISKLPVNMKPERWELIFYILCVVTCLWAFVVWFVLSDSPSNAIFLNHRERLIAVKCVSGNETGIKNKHFDKGQIVAGFTDPKTILIFISVFAAAIPNGVVNSFSTIIIRDMGFDITMTTKLKSVGDAVQIMSLLIGGIVILNVPNSRLLTATTANILCTVSAACMAYLPRSNTWGRLVAFWLVNSQSVGFTVALTTISSNMGGFTHRSLASALVFTAYCWGNFAGPFVVKPSEAPYYRGATIGLLAGYSIKTCCHLMVLAYMVTVNKRRDKIYGPANKEDSNEAGMREQTEFENKSFRYQARKDLSKA